MRDRGEDGVLGEGQLGERLAEVATRGGLHAVCLVAVEVLVEIRGDDVLLALVARVGLGEPDRLDDLADLALVRLAGERLGGQQSGADELLGDGRRAARTAGQRVESGADDADRVEARVRPEMLVLDGGRRIEHLVGDLIERDDLAAEGAEARQLDLVGAVVDDGLLLEIEVRQGRLGVRQASRVVVVSSHREQRPRSGREHGDQEDDDGDGDEDATEEVPALCGPAADRAPMALPPSERGLHLSRHDSIGTVNERSVAASRSATPPRASL